MAPNLSSSVSERSALGKKEYSESTRVQVLKCVRAFNSAMLAKPELLRASEFATGQASRCNCPCSWAQATNMRQHCGRRCKRSRDHGGACDCLEHDDWQGSSPPPPPPPPGAREGRWVDGRWYSLIERPLDRRCRVERPPPPPPCARAGRWIDGRWHSLSDRPLERRCCVKALGSTMPRCGPAGH